MNPPLEGVASHGGDQRARPSSLQLDLSTCVCRYGPPPAAVNVAQAVTIDRLRDHPYGAAERLVSAYARFLGVPEDELAPARGVGELVWRLAVGPLGPRVAAPLPGYTELRMAFPDRGVGPPAVHHDLDVVATALAAGSVVIISNPHNPSGRAFDRAELLAVARHHDEGVLVVDESFVEFCARPEEISVVGADLANVAAYRSPSKFFGLAGCRVGVVWARERSLRDAVAPRLGSWPVSALEVDPAVAALEDQAWVGVTRSRLLDDAEWLDKQAARLGDLVPGSVTHFRFGLAPDSEALVAQLARVGVGLRLLGPANGLPGVGFRIAAPRDDERPAAAAMLRTARRWPLRV